MIVYDFRNRFAIVVIDLLLSIPSSGGQFVKWMNHEREAQVIYALMTDC